MASRPASSVESARISHALGRIGTEKPKPLNSLSKSLDHHVRFMVEVFDFGSKKIPF